MRRSLSIIVLLSALCPVCGDDDVPEREAESVRRWTARTVAAIDVRARDGEDAEPVRLTASEKPLLAWTTPEVGRVYGDVYVWSENGRPRALAALFEWFDPHEVRVLEWTSVCDRSLRAVHDGQEVWRTGPAEVEWGSVPSTPAPHATPNGRLAQMRAVARRFSTRMVDPRSDPPGPPMPLRMLPSPIHRYASPGEGVVDGGIFAFVRGSDPELFLLIEARRGDAGDESWQALASRMNPVPLTLTRDGKELLHFDDIPESEFKDHRRPYCLVVERTGGGS